MSGVTFAVDVTYLVSGREMTAEVETALSRALNATAAKSRTMFSGAVREQIAFPASYLSPSAKRLWVKQKARRGAMQTVIEGRGAPTSLARFSKQDVLTGGRRHKGGKVYVTVKPGQRRAITRAFLMRLNNNNVGLAVRTDGSKPRSAYHPKMIGKNLWLLYGPSVDQALRAATDGSGVFEEMTPDALDFLEKEFTRQLELLSNG